MKWAIQAKEEEKNKPQTFSADGWTGIKDLHKCGEEMSKNSSLPSQEQQEQVSWMARVRGEGRDKGAKEFCPGWRHQPGQKAPFCPG